MSTLRVAKSQPYIITLDTLELQHITRSPYECYDTTVPIWRKSPKESYYEFEIVAESETKSDDTISEEVSVNDNCEKVMCHICNIKVPNNFITEHRASMKHKIFTKLAETAVERITKNINNFVEYKERNGLKYTYCEVCSEAVEDRSMHEATKKHLKALKCDDKIKLLLKLYTDKEPTENFDLDDDSDYDDKTNIENRNDLKHQEKLINMQDDPSLKSINNNETTKSMLNLNVNKGGLVKGINKRDCNNNSGKLYTDKDPTENFDLDDDSDYDNKTNIENRNDHKQQEKLINMQDDPSLKSINNNETTKSMLNLNVNKGGLVKGINKRDCNNKSGKAINCGRGFNYKINLNRPEKLSEIKTTITNASSSSKNPTGMTNVGMNQTTANDHKVKDDNYSKLENIDYFMANTVTNNALDDNIKYYIEPMVELIPGPKGKAFKVYITDMIKRYNLREVVPKVDGDSILIYSLLGKEQRVSIDNFHSFVMNFQGLFCILCQSQVGDVQHLHPLATDILEHARKKEHVLNILKPIDENFTRKMNNRCGHCIICNKLAVDVEFHGSMDTEHKQIMQISENSSTKSLTTNFKIPNYMQKYRRNSSTILCNVCNNDIPYNATSITLHCNNDPKHKENVSRLLKTHNITTLPKGHRCNTCNAVPKDILKHLFKRGHLRNRKNCCKLCSVNVLKKGMAEHVRKCSDFKASETSNVSNNADGNVDDKNVSKPKYANEGKQIACSTFNIKLAPAAKKLNANVTGESHNEQYFSLLFEHSIAEVLDSNWKILGYNCGVCDLKGLQNFRKHITTANHLNNLTKYDIFN